jgi:hypothetical protein
MTPRQRAQHYAATVAEDPAARRRALATVFDQVATEMVERVVAEAVRAANFFGLSGEVAQRYGQSIRATLPAALDALTEPTAAERDRKMGELVARVRSVSDEHHVPRIVERGLVNIAFGLARRLVHDRTAASGFTAEDLDSELMAFRSEFEQKLFER